MPLRRLDRFDDDLLTILKYPGKTNEQFTKLLLNVTLASSAFAGEPGRRRLAVLDPLCGRGTTLNQALMYGFDAYGADIDARDVEAYAVFIQRWLKDKRLKHQADFSPVRRDRKVVARRLTAEFAASKDEYKAGDIQHLEVVETDTSTHRRVLQAPLPPTWWSPTCRTASSTAATRPDEAERQDPDEEPARPAAHSSPGLGEGPAPGRRARDLLEHPRRPPRGRRRRPRRRGP